MRQQLGARAPLRRSSDFVAEIPRRTSCALTGSRVAGRMGRWPVEHAMRASLADPRLHGWTMPRGPPLACASYIDNLCGVGKMAAEVALAMQVLRSVLQREWRLGVNEGSELMLVSRGAPEVQGPPSGTDAEGDCWNVAGWMPYRSMSILGHQISWDGSSAYCWQRTAAAAWRKLWAVVGTKMIKTLPFELRRRWFRIAVQPLLAYRMPRWVWGAA